MLEYKKDQTLFLFTVFLTLLFHFSLHLKKYFEEGFVKKFFKTFYYGNFQIYRRENNYSKHAMS